LPQSKKASEKLEVMYLNEKEREHYDAQQKFYLDETSRLQEAIEQAEANRNVEISRNLIQLGLDNTTISKGTGLTVAQIAQLRKVSE
jgi:predicted transposase/invertase (TIGR01784 family)